jgi:hypothetical protein
LLELERVVFSSLLREFVVSVPYRSDSREPCVDMWRPFTNVAVSPSGNRKQTMVTTTAEDVSGFLESWLLRSSPFHRSMNHEERAPLSWIPGNAGARNTRALSLEHLAIGKGEKHSQGNRILWIKSRDANAERKLVRGIHLLIQQLQGGFEPMENGFAAVLCSLLSEDHEFVAADPRNNV